MKVNEAVRTETRSEQTRTAYAQLSDSKSKDFQNQIASAQSELKELASDNALSAEEKEKKRQEIQKQITELNNELKKHQLQLQREQQEKEKTGDASTDEEMVNSIAEDTVNVTGLSQNGVRAIIAADTSIQQARAQGNVALGLEGRVRVLSSEMKQDAARGKDTKAKQRELENLEDKAIKIKGTKMDILTDAAQEMKRAAQKELQPDKKSSEEKTEKTAHPATVPFHADTKKKTDYYKNGTMFSNVDFHI